jgi:hypothetical protein
MPEDSTPILVGCGDVTDMATPVEQGRSQFDLIAEAGRRAVADAVDMVAMLRLFSDTSHRFATKLGTSRAAMLAELKGVDVRRATVLPHEHELMLGAIERSHAGVALHAVTNFRP